MRNAIPVMIVIACLSMVGYVIYDDWVRDTTPCPNGYDEGDIVEHITANVKGAILDCKLDVIRVDIGYEVRMWRWEHVKELRSDTR